MGFMRRAIFKVLFADLIITAIWATCSLGHAGQGVASPPPPEPATAPITKEGGGTPSETLKTPSHATPRGHSAQFSRMQFITMSGVSGMVNPAAPPETAKKYLRQIAIAERAGIYGFLVELCVWLYGSWPDIFRGAPDAGEFVLAGLAGAVLMPLLHELLHLVAWPPVLLHRDTRLVLRINGLGSGFATIPGGVEPHSGKFLLISALPFLVLSALPVAAMAVTGHWSILIFLGAAYNASLSAVDLLHVFLIGHALLATKP